MQTGGGGEEQILVSSNPEVEALVAKPNIIEWSNLFDSDSVENPISNSRFYF